MQIGFFNRRNRERLLLLLVILQVVFIWFHSIQVGETSNAKSEQIAEQLKPIAKPAFDRVADADQELFGYDFHAIIRKTAHVTEFYILGLLLVCLYWRKKRQDIFAVLFVALGVAVLDEGIQIWNSRTDMVQDVLLDFASALVGIAGTALVLWLVSAIKKRAKRKPEIAPQ